MNLLKLAQRSNQIRQDLFPKLPSWRSRHDPPPSPFWAGLRRYWVTARSLRVLARSFAITALILIPGVIANAPRSPGTAAAAAAASIGSVALFCLIVTGVALALARAVGQA